MRAQVLGNHLAQHGTKIRSEREVAAFVELLGLQAGPLAIDLATLNRPAHHEHAIRVAVVGPAVAVLVRGAAEFGHRNDHNVLHAVAHILRESRHGLPQVTRNKFASWPCAPPSLTWLSQPPVSTNVTSSPMSRLIEGCATCFASSGPRGHSDTSRAIFRLQFRRIGLAQHVDRFERPPVPVPRSARSTDCA